MKKVRVLIASLLIITSMTTLSFSSNAYNINDRTDSKASSSARSGSNYKMLFLYLNEGTDLSLERKDTTIEERSVKLSEYDNVNTYVISPDKGYHVTYEWDRNREEGAYYNYIDYISYVKKYVNYILADRKTKYNKIFISTPSSYIDDKQKMPNSANIEAFFTDLRANFSDEVWDNNIEGIYVYDEEYTDDGRYHKRVADIMRDNNEYRNKKLLWCPYYQVYGEITHILNTYENLFDIILIQPHYYFGGTNVLGNLKDWIENQEVNGVSSGDTVLGVQLEIDMAYDTDWVKDGQDKDRKTWYGKTHCECVYAYNLTAQTFEKLKKRYPMSHFGDAWKENLTYDEVYNAINQFYNY